MLATRQIIVTILVALGIVIIPSIIIGMVSGKSRAKCYSATCPTGMDPVPVERVGCICVTRPLEYENAWNKSNSQATDTLQ